ncbi:hypothetical protein [Devosia faecipullorum]|uniref:hypothetical protein n=1 Tax=Devosia faecipullorum TaxID=2755039 RepID=UPI00187B651A|nr:hypothetical protein [Devosia faecipullorum]MBE7732153.1 hypothetical protein [Devosia faecipullorum]
MKTAKNAHDSATESLALKHGQAPLITVHRDGIVAAAELIAEAVRESMGWQYKQSSPVLLAELLLKASARPHIEYPGLADLISAHAMLMTIAKATVVNDRSPEGIAIAKLAARTR